MRQLIMSRLIWIYAVCKNVLSSCVAVKELKRGNSDVLFPFWKVKAIYYPFRAGPFSEGIGVQESKQSQALSPLCIQSL